MLKPIRAPLLLRRCLWSRPLSAKPGQPRRSEPEYPSDELLQGAASAMGYANSWANDLQKASAAALNPLFCEASPIKGVLETARSHTNHVLAAVNAPVRLEAQHVEQPAAHPTEREHFSTWKGRSPVPADWVATYVEAVLNEPDSVVNSAWVPDVLEKQVYCVVVRLLLHMIHYTVGIGDQRLLFGNTLRMYQEKGNTPLRVDDCKVPYGIVAHMVEEIVGDCGDSQIISASIDRLLYENIAKFALRLVVDIASSLHIEAFGLHFHVQASTVDGAKLRHHKRSAIDVTVLEASCEPLIQEMLADPDINIAFLPDAMEERVYRIMMRLVANVLAAAVDDAEVQVCGIRITPDLE